MAPIIVVGLGNPGEKYQQTRHNAGFMVVDLLASRLGCSQFKDVSSRLCLETSAHHSCGKLVLCKPQTYMNRSGQSVRRVLDYYRTGPGEILVVHDDLDLPLGRIKAVRGGGAGGHNGIRSIIQELGTKDFPRLKIGIGRPQGPIPVDRYVLSRFSEAERQILEDVLHAAVEAVECFCQDGIEMVMNRFNGVDLASRSQAL